MKKYVHEFLNDYLVENKSTLYNELEFMCSNSNMNDSSDLVDLKSFYNELKELQKDVDYNILPYMQDFSDEKHKEYSLAVIILDKSKESELEKIIFELAIKYDIEFDLYGEKTDNQVNGIIRGDLYNNLI